MKVIKKYLDPSGTLETSNEPEFKATPVTFEEYKNKYLNKRPFQELFHDFIVSNGANGQFSGALLDFDVFASKNLGSFRKPWLGRFVDKIKDIPKNYHNWLNEHHSLIYPWWRRHKISLEEIDQQNLFNSLYKNRVFVPKFKYRLNKYGKATLKHVFNGIINNHDLLLNNPEYADYWKAAYKDLKHRLFYVGDMKSPGIYGYYDYGDRKARVDELAKNSTNTTPVHELAGHGTYEYLSNNLTLPYKDFLKKYPSEGTKAWDEIRASTMEFRSDLIRKATRFRPWRRRNPKVLRKFMQRALDKMSDLLVHEQWQPYNGYTYSYDINSGYVKDLRNLVMNAYKCGGVIRKLRLGGVPYDLEETTVTPERNGIRTNSRVSNVLGNPQSAPEGVSVPNVNPTVTSTNLSSTVKHTVKPLQNNASDMPWYAPRLSHRPEESEYENTLEQIQEPSLEEQMRYLLKSLGYTDEEIEQMINGTLPTLEEPQYRSTEGLTRSAFDVKDSKYYKPEELYDWLLREYFRVTDIDDIESMRTYNLVNYSMLGVFGDEFKNWFNNNHSDLVLKLYNSSIYQFDQTIAPYKGKVKFISSTNAGSPTYSKLHNTIYFSPNLEYLQELKNLIQKVISNLN